MPHKVMILDDEVGISSVVEEILMARGFSVDTAHSQKKAKWLLARTEYTVAILDLGLTSLDGTAGLDMVSYVRKINPDTRIIVYTGNDNPDVKQLALDAGADMFILKPGPVKKLELAVVKFCGGTTEPEHD
jgi:DNA-binding response OmpR family regulator